MSLRWERQDAYEAEWAYCGNLVVGMIGTRSRVASEDGKPRYWYRVDGVHMKHIAKGYGEVQSEAAARKAVERAWETWLKLTGLRPFVDVALPYAGALRMVREAIEELFGPMADMESEEAVLLRGPEPHHDAEAIIAALQRVQRAVQSGGYDE
ncbi:MAG: hypothetical protein E5V74_01755 [Mesorhizobium sp.]|nr:MAG: hypothetical protein E5V74_01755 [Mesorhizobium sp.]